MVVALLGVAMFLVIILALVGLLMVAKANLVPAADVKIIINDDEENPVIAQAGGTLLNVLSSKKIFIPSACGGGGTCGVCVVHVHEGGGAMLLHDLPRDVHGARDRRALGELFRDPC